MVISLKDSYNLPMARFFTLAALLLGSLASTAAQADFGIHLASHLGFGNLGGDNQKVESRSMGVLDLQALPGYRVPGGLLVGPHLNVRFLSQLNGGGDEEFSGAGSLIGLGAMYELATFKALASYDMRARHSHSEPDTTYMGSGFTLLVGFLMMPMTFLDIEFNKTTYNMQTQGDTTHHLGSRFTHWNVGVGVSLTF